MDPSLYRMMMILMMMMMMMMMGAIKTQTTIIITIIVIIITITHSQTKMASEASHTNTISSWSQDFPQRKVLKIDVCY